MEETGSEGRRQGISRRQEKGSRRAHESEGQRPLGHEANSRRGMSGDQDDEDENGPFTPIDTDMMDWKTSALVALEMVFISLIAVLTFVLLFTYLAEKEQVEEHLKLLAEAQSPPIEQGDQNAYRYQYPRWLIRLLLLTLRAGHSVMDAALDLVVVAPKQWAAKLLAG